MDVHSYDVLIVGGGMAGVAAALTAAEKGLKAVLATKDFLGYGNTKISGGIIAAAGACREDSAEIFIEDLQRAGAMLNDKVLLEVLATENAGAIAQLTSWGHVFVRDEKGNLDQNAMFRPAGHSITRTFMSYYGGRSLSQQLRFALAAQNVALMEETLVCSLLTKQDRMIGALCFDISAGQYFCIASERVILACGGGGMLYYPHTDNNRGSTCDGYALALEAGAALIDMELLQYLPFGLLEPAHMCGASFGEPANAGPYGVFRNSSGETVLSDIQMLSRNQAAKKIVELRTRYNGDIYLDLSANLTSDEGRQAWQKGNQIGVNDILKLALGPKGGRWEIPINVFPTVHFFLGGIKIDSWGLSSVSNLYAAGEVAGGIHGADRLGSVALAEALVFGIRAVAHAAESVESQEPDRAELIRIAKDKLGQERECLSRNPLPSQKMLRETMWRYAGPWRDGVGLSQALKMIEGLKDNTATTNTADQPYSCSVRDAWELKFMIRTGEAVVRSAILREESVGMHVRSDFPYERASWRNCNIQTALHKNGEIGGKVVHRA